MRRASPLAIALLLGVAGCVGGTRGACRPFATGAPAEVPTVCRFRAPEPWAEPIRDYLAAGEKAFPDGFNRAITALAVFPEGGGRSRLWIGYGDATQNLGTRIPIEFRCFESPDDPTARAARVVAGPPAQGAPQRSPTDTGEEQIEPYRTGCVCAGEGLLDTLWQAGVDSNDPDESWTQAKPGPKKLIEGNLYRLEDACGEPVWRKFRSVPGGEHVHDVAAFENALYAVGSGADNREEWEGGRIFRYLWKSTDGGATFSVVHRAMFPDLGKGDTRFRRLLAVGDTLYAFGYLNPFVEKGPIEGRHLALRDGAVAEVEGEVARLVVTRAWSLDPDLGLVLTRAADGTGRAFVARCGGFRELTAWAGRRVVDLAPGRVPGEVLVLSGDRGNPEAFAVHRTTLAALEVLDPVIEPLPTPCTALALWQGSLFLGTADGRVLRARCGE